MTRLDNTRTIRAATGTELTAKSWLTEAPLRMLMNNLHPDVAERPEELVVYGGIGRAARDWNAFDKIVETLQGFDDPVEAVPVARRPADAAIDDQFLRPLGDVRMQVVHQHAQRRFGQP